ncbi:MAG: hypothetical protein HRU09_06590 [Oligoflexales bacterium]|nr:hypothetical protein [Oligoflexales bacterium]
MDGFKTIACLVILVGVLSCAGGGSGGVYGLSEGSKPINQKEELQYKKALIRCHKTGGSRIVKIKGKLRCF